MKEKLSVVIPCFHCEKTLPHLIQAFDQECNWLSAYDLEIILVNDGSGTATWDTICALVQTHPFCQGVDLARNCGQHNAILAGMSCTSGDYIVGLDDDLQTHPSQIPLLLHTLAQGYDVVYGRFPRRRHSGIRNLLSGLSERSARWLLDKPGDLKACPMYAIRRFVRDEIVRSPSAYTNLLGLFLRTTQRIANVEIEHFERASGTSGYTVRKLFRLWSSYLNYSLKPLRLLLAAGFLSVSIALFWLISHLFTLHSDASLMMAWCLLLTGILLLGMGLMSEYLGRMFMIVTKEPQYVVRAYAGKAHSPHAGSGRGECTDRSDPPVP